MNNDKCIYTPEEMEQLVKYFELLIKWDQQEKAQLKNMHQGESHEQTSMPVPTETQCRTAD